MASNFCRPKSTSCTTPSHTLVLIKQEHTMNTMKRSEGATPLYYHPKKINLSLGLLFLVLVVAGEAFRRVELEESINFWTVVPPLLFPLWVQYWNVWDKFLWTKTISLIPFAVIWCSIVRQGIDISWTQLGTFFVLSFNIAVAVTKDLSSKRGRVTWNQLNALSGILLILSELPTLHTVRISDDEIHDFLWTHGPPWIIGECFNIVSYIIVCHHLHALFCFNIISCLI